MVHYVKREKTLSAELRQLYVDEERKVLIFSRGNSIFAFNFNPTASLTDFSFQAADGEYAMAFNSDEARFGGFSRLLSDERHATMDGRLSLYLPSRVAIVLKMIK